MIRVRLVKDFLEEILEKSFFFLLMGFQNIIKKKKKIKEIESGLLFPRRRQ